MRLLPIFIVLSVLPAATAADPKRAGADWWSLQKLRAVAPPAVADLPADANPIDAFVRAKLRDNGLTPSPPADRRTLIRRLTFDLTGLPPSPAEVDAFLADTSAEAYERVIDRLLAAPGYGERWGRHWLDVVRYSESHGFEYDRLRDHGWRYRDYVIKSLNDDKPYADFVREQLAGDVLPRATRDGIAATGFLVAGPFDQAGSGSVSPIVRGKVREDELEDTLGTVGQTFLGATMNCARCHDHKVDPYTARDYYRMKAVFEGVYAGDRPLQTAEEIRARGETTAALDKRIADVQAVLALLDSAARRRVLAKRPAGTAEPDTGLPKPVARWTFDVDGRDSVGELHAIAKNGAKFAHGRLVVDGTAAFAETPPLPFDLKAKTLEAWVAVPTLDQGGGGVISVQTTGGRTFDALTFAERQPRQWTAGSEGFLRTRDVAGPDETAAPNELIHLAITYTAEGRITLFRNGRPYGEGYAPAGQTLTFKAKEARVLFGLRHTGGARPFLKAEIEEARLYDTALTPEQMLASDRAGVERVTAAELAAAMTAEESSTAKTANETLARLRREWDDARQQALAYAANPRQPGATVVLKRGDVEKPGEAVTAGSPAVVQGPPGFDLPAAAPEGERRRAFAEWVVHADNPLTWRVIVNRAWQHHFGEGIVRTPNDFGLNGERPTHPELLDWLAGQFRAGGGRLKSLHKLIVMSATYRQASAFDAKTAAIDADNRLLWRYAPRRLEAEAIRDAMLAASGKLNPAAGGPSFRPFKIENFNSSFYILYDEDRPDFNRRSVYRMNVNSAKDPVLDVLDCPDPSTKTPRRNATTTPLQALTLMNNAFTDRMARTFAERLTAEAKPADRIAAAYRLAFGRPPTDAETARAEKVMKEAGLKAVCWALLNASEFVYLK